MRIRPRQQLLQLWRTVLDRCYRDQQWHWGGRDGANSISDAEQLLYLLYPATEISARTPDRTGDMAPDVAAVLAPRGRNIVMVRGVGLLRIR
ncbi:hypothetical protein [Nocardia vinacea]|uniref:hypothetical protein n=1 Tax=Nocardia vinacea TaxID=96468 RepID=UPI0012F70178|nr:hypothetical protein [Nocardia vinacea]